ncbi:glutamine synthetase family protein [Desulfofustis limnaeus]|jgi:glutamine synthetase|uniref:Glutamine synthetase n=1 Tax=Desulfofustis limnaeus TaxID=2740163 RepID=A0ABM7WC08_9BACT|nr:glutamine synthetase family protein [Desulfofustis limnaeus]MDX9895842.1 glutamine synthetase family protein [Desulfofustis sp.]BDD88435.1 glutamine synthetase [Desulfofustis limnaeus]
MTMDDMQDHLRNLDATKIFFTDLNGRLMSLPVNPAHLPAILRDGIGFDGSSIAGMARVDNSDRQLFPDIDSLRIITFKEQTLGCFIGRIFNERGLRSQADPRAVLERVIEEAEKEYGYRFLLGPEHEFFLLSGDEFGEKKHSDEAGYFVATPHDKGERVRNRIIAILAQCGIEFEKAHHEVTPSQHEINLVPTRPLDAADRTVIFNHITHQVAREFGYYATFMPKPFDNQNRSAFHIHLSMSDLDGNNVFYDADQEYGLSTTARQFIGGIIKYGRETSLVMASTFNSYKAYVVEREAPVIRGWGLKNRSSMVRIPYAVNPQSTRIELRNPDPCGNPYLQMATLIAMGLRGIEEKLDCGRPDRGSAYGYMRNHRIWDQRLLPKSMFEALVEAERSKFLPEVLGKRIYDSYMALKTADWEEHRTHVTPREWERYLGN